MSDLPNTVLFNSKTLKSENPDRLEVCLLKPNKFKALNLDDYEKYFGFGSRVVKSQTRRTF